MSGSVVGARFCVLLAGDALCPDVGAGPEESQCSNPSCLKKETGTVRNASHDEDSTSEALARFRDAFIMGVSAAAAISPSRVRVLDVGRPLGASRRVAAAVAGSNESHTSPVKELRQEGPDTGAGVLAFLGTDLRSSREEKEELSANPLRLPLQERSESVERVDVDQSVTRVLAVIREHSSPSPRDSPPANSDCNCAPTCGGGTSSIQDAGDEEEPNAVQALELVLAELADPQSALQQAMMPWTGGKAARLWCPEQSPKSRSSHRRHVGGAVARRTSPSRPPSPLKQAA
eukprot:gnl/TRDRNA2_/TRDRNA2_81135_c0_seq1.p1 gnl/TRDRNA2_/TRDRNA2_81135_c0~~gnl/TRDRNA2_/TRDRNA2_81135_c0_seq1.p1  ORF type:complete len:289 (-),score=54.17 gnl/TRDRNA2_/TRDRNA2_81135_c0_seq1:36-902(-)